MIHRNKSKKGSLVKDNPAPFSNLNERLKRLDLFFKEKQIIIDEVKDHLIKINLYQQVRNIILKKECD